MKRQPLDSVSDRRVVENRRYFGGIVECSI